MLRHFQADPENFPLSDHEVDELTEIAQQYSEAARTNGSLDEEILTNLVTIAFTAGRSYEAEHGTSTLDPTKVNVSLTPRQAEILLASLLGDD
jgi:hypothetical protein